jgi:hypothetical protein
MFTEDAKRVIDGKLVAKKKPKLPANISDMSSTRAQIILSFHKELKAEWTRDDQDRKNACAEGFKLIEKYVSRAVIERVLAGKYAAGDLKAAWDLLDKEYGSESADQVLQSTTISEINKYAYFKIVIGKHSTFSDYWNEHFQHFGNMHKGDGITKRFDIDVFGRGSDGQEVLDLVIAAIERSGAPWTDYLKTWESVSNSTRTLESLLAYMKRQPGGDGKHGGSSQKADATSTKGKRDAAVAEITTSPPAKLLRVFKSMINQAVLKQLKPGGVGGGGGAGAGNGRGAKGSDKSSGLGAKRGKGNLHPQFHHQDYLTADERCWNCGGTHATRDCKATTCAYCHGEGHNFWRCEKRTDDKKKAAYQFLPPKECKRSK